MNLFNLTQKHRALKEMMLDNETDEQAIQDTLEMVESSIEEKADGYAYIITELDAQVNMITAEVERLSAYKKRIVNNKLMLKSNLLFTMQDTEKTKFMTEFHQFGTRKSKAVNIIDSELIPSAYMKEKTTWTVDKVKIKDVINSGEAVEGAEIVERESLVIK